MTTLTPVQRVLRAVRAERLPGPTKIGRYWIQWRRPGDFEILIVGIDEDGYKYSMSHDYAPQERVYTATDLDQLPDELAKNIRKRFAEDAA